MSGGTYAGHMRDKLGLWNLFKLLAKGVDVPEKFIGLEALGVLAKVLRERLEPAQIRVSGLASTLQDTRASGRCETTLPLGSMRHARAWGVETRNPEALHNPDIPETPQPTQRTVGP